MHPDGMRQVGREATNTPVIFEGQKESPTNRRRHLRYPLRAAIVYRWRDEQGAERQGRGWAQDLSEEGVLVLSENCPKIGDFVELTVRVASPRPPAPSSTLIIDMNGKVIRMLNESGQGKSLGFAVRKRSTGCEVDGKSPLLWQDRGLASSRRN